MGRKSEIDDTNDRNLAVCDMKITVASVRIIFNGRPGGTFFVLLTALLRVIP